MIEFLILILSICSSFDLFFTKVGNLELEPALRVEKRNIRFPFFLSGIHEFEVMQAIAAAWEDIEGMR